MSCIWTSLNFELAQDARNGTEPATGSDTAAYVMPRGLIGFKAAKRNHRQLSEVIGEWPLSQMLAITAGEEDLFFVRTELIAGPLAGKVLPPEVSLVQQGDIVFLPIEPATLLPASLTDMLFVPASELRRLLGGRPSSEPEVIGNPLSSFSLRGSAAEFEERAVSAKPLLGDVCYSGQTTIWYAPPNAGKTLIALKLLDDAIEQGLINPANVFYVDADDSSEGFATKMRLMDDRGVHTLAPGYNGLTRDTFVLALHDLATEGKARGVLVIIDTVKKFVSLMDKAKSAAFANVCRRIAMNGGTILGLAHTTKSPNADGSMRYAGTSDLVDDSDAAYVIASKATGDGSGDLVAEFKVIKRRGSNAGRVAYAFAGDGGISYEERLASVRLVDPQKLDDFQVQEVARLDSELIEVALACIKEGITAKMVLAKAVASRAKVSERKAIQLIERYTGEDPAKHHWTYAVRARGAKVFEALAKPEAGQAGDPTPDQPQPC